MGNHHHQGCPRAPLAAISGDHRFGDFAIGDQAADAAHSTVAPATASITADGTSTQVITVQARDVFNVNLPTGGSTVVISKSAGTGTMGSTTDTGNGTYTATVTSPTASGSGTFTATLGGTAVGTAVSAIAIGGDLRARGGDPVGVHGSAEHGNGGDALQRDGAVTGCQRQSVESDEQHHDYLEQGDRRREPERGTAGTILTSGNSVTISTPVYSKADTIR